VTLVCGPPGSGKSTFARTLDLSVYEAEAYRTDREFVAAAYTASRADDARMVVVRCCPTPQDRAAWARTLRATRVVVMDTPLEVCIERIRRRGRPRWKAEIGAARTWR
jgi:predicted kinase